VLPGFDIWARGYGLWGNGNDRSFRFGSDMDTGGIAGGVTYRWNTFFLGGAAGWSRDRVDYNLGNSRGHNNSWQLGLFGGWQSGPWSADFQIDYAHGRMRATRSISVASIVRKANADTDGHLWKFIGTAGYDFDLGGLKLRPFVGFDHTTGKLDAFAESGAGAANLTVDDIDAGRADLLVGLDLKANPNTQFSPY